MNVSATVNILRLFRDPSLCLPHYTIPTFHQLPIPLSTAFASRDGEKKADIRAVVLDKDNCFAVPKQNIVYEPYDVGAVPFFAGNLFLSEHSRLLYNAHILPLLCRILSMLGRAHGHVFRAMKRIIQLILSAGQV